MKRSFVYSILVILILSAVSFSGATSLLAAAPKERVRISGEVSNIRKVKGKWIGRARFTGKTRQGVSYSGSGPVEIRFNRDKTEVKRMVIRFTGTRDGRNVSGTIACYQKIVFQSAVGSSFEFSQVAGSSDGNDI